MVNSKWNQKDEVCPTCGRVTKEARGLTKQNLLKLFRRPTIQDWVILAMMVLIILAAFSYQSEIKQYKEIIRNPQELCSLYYQNILHGNFGEDRLKDIQNLTIIQSP